MTINGFKDNKKWVGIKRLSLSHGTSLMDHFNLVLKSTKQMGPVCLPRNLLDIDFVYNSLGKMVPITKKVGYSTSLPNIKGNSITLHQKIT